jgi:predicted phage baseplate assembly protein
VLDNRTFAQLVSECIGQINRLSPNWTNYNASDPGITLIELISWLSEQNLYRTDRITPEMIRAFLRLVGVTPNPAGVASTVVLLSTSSGMPVALPDRVQLTDQLGAVTFETREAVTISPARLVQLLTGRAELTDVTTQNLQPFDPSQDDRLGTFAPFGASPAPGAALYLGFDQPLGTPGNIVALHVWTRTPLADAATASALRAEWASQQAAAQPDYPPGVLVPDWRLHYSARVAWEFFAGGTEWRSLDAVEDDTRALTLTGFVRFAAPSGHVAGGPGRGWFVRCRLLSGSFECPTWIDRIAINAVTAEHAVSIDQPETLGVSKGHAGTHYDTSLSPIVAGTSHLTLISSAQRDTTWTEVTMWDLVGPHDRRYLLETERGRITGGNGMRAAVLPAGWQLQLDYRVGGDIEGNIPAAHLVRLAMSGWNTARIPGLAGLAGQITVEQPYAAAGGAAAETLQAAEARALAQLSAPSTTVTLADFVTLALETPGVPVGRAKAVANRHPAVPCFDAPGSITVIVVPNCPGPAPMPGPDFLAAVQRYLHPRRPITTEIHAIAPDYVQVTIAAQLEAAANTDPNQIAASAQTALDAFFAPLSGGPRGSGWPIGRSVYRTEIMTILAGLPGVLTVSNLTLAADGGTPTCDNLDLCAGDLVQSMTHAIQVGISGTTIFERSKERECS